MHRMLSVSAVIVCLMAMEIALTIVGCSTPNGFVEVNQLVGRGMVAPGADVEALHRGRALAATECMGCHRIYWPNEYAPTEWPAIVRKMGARSSLSESQIRDLELYLVAASQTARLSNKDAPAAKSGSGK
jgi:mono/diheme cytochrome c family protein